MPTHSNSTRKGAAAAMSDSTELRVWILTIDGRSRAYLWEVSAQRAYDREHRRGKVVKRETALLKQHDASAEGAPDAWLVTIGWCNCGGSERHVYLNRHDADDAVAAYEAKHEGALYYVEPASVTAYVVTDRAAWRWTP